ncbi:hypothetical protein PR202_ga00034 [Eleusine coracana subsp. coracana]|uniref:Alpha/beta hydrolase fold-3 domain-containing protein n=1 Tax=Eleusine coracana subsp. coracana TaxID=191504 RepID=A0AAV5BFZ1_ELECO|nr:hypothetical protein PR202_ga00034 [Eleusine coracana subsp. coracana]
MMGAAASVFREQASWIPPQEDPAGDDSVVEYDVPPFIRQYKSGRVERYGRADAVPAAGTDDASSRDVVVNPGTGLWARLYLPGAAVTSRRRIPVVVFHHGGGFVAGSTAQRSTHAYLKRLAADAGVLVVSPEYRLAPEHPLPAALDGSWWEALAAGATIAHNMAARAGFGDALDLSVFKGLVLVHPFFAGEQAIGGEPADRVKAGTFWRYRCPGTTAGLDDALCNPFADGGASACAARVAACCESVLVCVAEKDALRDRGVRTATRRGRCTRASWTSLRQ